METALIKYIFDKADNTFNVGYYNELLISGNLIKKGLRTKCLHNYNPNYDILVGNDKTTKGMECKLDLLSQKTNNFYFEYYNYTFNRWTGIYNEDMNSLFSYTYMDNGKFFALMGKRQTFKEAV